MNLNEVKDFWLEEAQEALQVASHLFEKQDYSYSLFFGHLAIEKLLKAIYVIRHGEQAPYMHNLIRLAELSGIIMDNEQREALTTITVFGLESRYPDEKRGFRKKCTHDFTARELDRIRGVSNWLKSIL